MQSAQSIKKYDKQFIITIGRKEEFDLLQNKWKRTASKQGRNPDACYHIDYDKNENKFINPEILSEATPNSRIYVTGHAGPNADFMTDNKKAVITSQELTDFFVKYVPQHTAIQGLTISVTGCCAAAKTWAQGKKHLLEPHIDSFAGRLTKALHEKNFKATVYARLGVLSICDADQNVPCPHLHSTTPTINLDAFYDPQYEKSSDPKNRGKKLYSYVPTLITNDPLFNSIIDNSKLHPHFKEDHKKTRFERKYGFFCDDHGIVNMVPPKNSHISGRQSWCTLFAKIAVPIIAVGAITALRKTIFN